MKREENRCSVPFHRPDIGREELDSVRDSLLSGWLTTGPKVKRFEEDFKKAVGASHAVAVNSATAALHLALEAIGIKAEDEVIVPTMTFTATAEVVCYFKARPVLVDCDPETLNITPMTIEKAITPRTKAIIPVHMAGQPCDMDAIMAIARRHKLKVIEDAAHSLPAYYKGMMIGTIGDITCFSFYATKTITTGEGGMAVTDNAAWAKRMRIMSLHGISKDAWKRYTAEGSWYYEVVSPGFKYNMTDLAAAIGIEQLKKNLRFWQRRRKIAETYNRAFAGVEGLERPTADAAMRHAWHLYILKLVPEKLRIDRSRFIDMLKERGVGTSVHFIPLHLHPFYRKAFGYRPADFPSATRAFQRIVSLPIFPSMSDTEVRHVITTVKEVIAENHLPRSGGRKC